MTQIVVIDKLYGEAPVQAEGTIDGDPFYFRARYEWWSIGIGGHDPIGDPDWFFQEKYGTGPFDAGYMSHEQAAEFIRAAAKRYAERRDDG